MISTHGESYSSVDTHCGGIIVCFGLWYVILVIFLVFVAVTPSVCIMFGTHILEHRAILGHPIILNHRLCRQ